jgi:hypothetical protein
VDFFRFPSGSIVLIMVVGISGESVLLKQDKCLKLQEFNYSIILIITY